MINIEECKLSKRLGKTRRNVRWSRGRKGTRHHSSRIVLKGSQPKMRPKYQKHWEKGQGNILLNVGAMREIACIKISLTEEKE
jgi:hypothetical protein